MKFKKRKSCTKYFLLILYFFFVQINFAFSADIALSNAGFIKSGIWYSKDPFYSGDKVRIYTVIIDGSEYDLIGDVEFRDNEKVLCKKPFAVTSGRTQELWCDWTAILGAHKITARIISPKIAPVGETPKPVILENNISGVSDRDVKVPPPPPKVAEEKKEISNNSLPQTQGVNGKIVDVNSKNNLSDSASSSLVEEKIQNSLNVVQKSFTGVVPTEIKKEDIAKFTDKIVSYIPKTIKDKSNKLVASLGLDKLKGPISYVIDFFVAIYKFIVNDSLVLTIILLLITWFVLKTIFQKIKEMY